MIAVAVARRKLGWDTDTNQSTIVNRQSSIL
jgi:hypothetical protein